MPKEDNMFPYQAHYIVSYCIAVLSVSVYVLETTYCGAGGEMFPFFGSLVAKKIAWFLKDETVL